MYTQIHHTSEPNNVFGKYVFYLHFICFIRLLKSHMATTDYRSLYEIKDAHELRHIAILAGARVSDLVDSETGKVYDDVPTLTAALKRSTTKNVQLFGLFRKLFGVQFLLFAGGRGMRMAFPEMMSAWDTRSRKAMLEKSNPNKKVETTVTHYWKDGLFVRDTKDTVANHSGSQKVKSSSVNTDYMPRTGFLLDVVFGLYYVSRTMYTPFQKSIPKNIKKELYKLNTQSAQDDQVFNQLMSQHPGAGPQSSYEITDRYLKYRYPELDMLFEALHNKATSSKALLAKSKVNVMAHNHPRMLALRKALLNQTAVTVRPIHLFRVDSTARDSVAEVALAFYHKWQYREVPRLLFNYARTLKRAPSQKRGRSQSVKKPVKKMVKKSAKNRARKASSGVQ